MKKTALTIGLFSLVMVATSFANPQTISTSNLNNVGTDGDGMTGGKRKLDFHGENDVKTLKNSQLNFDNVNQSFGGNKKID